MLYIMTCNVLKVGKLTIIFHPNIPKSKVLIELFSLGVTAEALRANIGSKSAISFQRGPINPKFQVDGVAPHQPFFVSENWATWSFLRCKNVEGSFFRFSTIRVWQTDRLAAFSSLDRVCIACSAVKTSERICTIDGSKRVKSDKYVPFGGFRQKFSPQPPNTPNSENFALRKQFFAQNTYKSWRKRCQNSYLNRKQPMGISNLGIKIWPKVVL